MIHLALQDLRHDVLTFGFSAIGIAVLVFAFLLLIPLSLAVTRVGEAGGPPQNLILIEQDVLQPEQSRIPPGLMETAAAILGDRLERIDPVIFRIMRVEDRPIQLRGVASQAWTTTFGLRLVDGTWPADPLEVVIGLLAAQDSDWRAGREINIYGTRFRVAGVAEGPGTQTQAIWMSYQTASDLFGQERGPQLLVAHLRSSADPIASRQVLEEGLRGAGYDVYFEDALLREYGAALNDLRSLWLVAATIAIAAVTLGSHNLAWLAAEERRRLLGVLRAVGFERRVVARYLLIRAGGVTVAAYSLALAAALVFIGLGIGPTSLNIGGTRTGLSLTPGIAGLGLLLTCAASLAGTWLSVRSILGASPASLLERGPGSSFA
jgi:hypothetical protein